MPFWSHGGDEIFHVDAQNNMTVARVETDPDFRVIDYEVLFRIPEDIFFNQQEWREDDEVGRSNTPEVGSSPHFLIPWFLLIGPTRLDHLVGTIPF